jgi:hypothetical protein
MRFVRLSLPLLCAATFLTGCGFTADTIAPVAPSSKGVHGKIMGGQQPVVGATVSVYALGVGGADAALLASTTSDQYGNFAFNTGQGNDYTCPAGPLQPEVGGGAKAKGPGTQAAKVEPKMIPGKLSFPEGRPNLTAKARPKVLPDLTVSYVYVTASGGDSGSGLNSSILLAAGMGACPDALNEAVEINEVSTVVFANAMENYSLGGGTDYYSQGSSYEAIAAMDVADTNTIQTFVDLSTGLVQPNVVSTAPGGTSITIEAAKIYSLANTIGSCVNSADDPENSMPSMACQNLYNSVADAGITNTLDAAVDISYSPFANVATLWGLGSAEPPFPGGLTAAPNDWTLGISYTTSTMGLGLFPAGDGSPTGTNIDIDSNGRVWFPSNKINASGVGYFDPTETAFNGPFGGAYVLQPQYVALNDQYQTAIVTDFASNNLVFVDTTPGGMNMANFLDYSDMLGGTYPTASGPIFINSDNSFDFAYTDSDGGYDFIYVNSTLTGGGQVGSFVQPPTGMTLNTTLGNDPNDPSDPIAVAATSGPSTLCSLEVAGDTTTQGSLQGALSTGTSPCTSGGAATGPVYFVDSGSEVQDEITVATTANEICSALADQCATVSVEPVGGGPSVNLVNLPVGVAFDGGDEVWLANSGNGSIAVIGGTSNPDTYTGVSDRPYLHNAANGGTMSAPAGIAIDSAGDIWVSNATCANPMDTTCSFTLSEVLGAAYPTITPLANQADQFQGLEPYVGASARGVATRKMLLRKSTSTAKVILGKGGSE